MANSELVYNIVYRIQGEQDIQKSINYVSSLTGDFKLLEQEIKKTGNVMGRQSKALMDNADQIRSVINRQEKLRAGLKRTDADYVRLTNSILRGKKALAEIDQIQSKYNKTTRATQSTYNRTLLEAQRLSVSYRELQSQVRAGTITQTQAEEKAKELAQSLAYLEEELIIVAQKSGISAAQFDKLRQAMTSARNGSVSATRAVEGVSDAFTGNVKVNSSANQLLLSFGDIAQDSAQFSYGFAQGARAIGNNIAFASEQVLILTSKMEAAKKGSATFKGVMKELGTQFMGPVGVIFAINAAVTAITMFATWQEKTKRNTEKATDAFKEQAQSLVEITKSFGLEGDFRFFEITNILEAKESLEIIDAQIKALEISTSLYNRQLLASYVNMGSYADEIQKTVERQNVYKQVIADNAAATSVLRNEQDRLNEQYVLISNLSPEARDELKKLSDEYKAQQELLELSRKQLRLTGQGGKEYLDVVDNVKRITKELEVAEAERALGLKTTGITEEEARKQLEVLRDSLDKGTMSADLYNDAVLRISSAYPKLVDSADDAARGIRDTMAGLELGLFKVEISGDPEEIKRAQLAILDERIKNEDLTENEIALARAEINQEYNDAILSIEKNRIKAVYDYNLLSARDNADEIRRLKLEELDRLAGVEMLSDEAIRLEKAKIEQEYQDYITREAERGAKEREKIFDDSVKRQEEIIKSFSSATKQINNQVVSSIQGTFQALVGSSKKAAIIMLAIEKAFAIGKIKADAQAAINKLEVEGVGFASKAAVALLTGNFKEAGENLAAAGKVADDIIAIKGTAKKNMAKVAAIGLAQAATALSTSGSSRGGGGVSSSAGGGKENDRGFGFSQRDVDRPQMIKSPSYIPRSQSSSTPNVKVDILADRRTLYAMVKAGEEESRQIAVS